MDVMTTARSIGLIGADGSDVFGTIERHVVLGALADLAADNLADADLYAAAADKVRGARSAGVERLGESDFLGRAQSAGTNAAGEIQLSYRSEMADIFLDLTIDIGLRHSPSPAVG